MAIRTEDKKWIQEQIDSAIAEVVDSLRPHGWRKTIFVLRELGPLVATIAVLVAMLGITLGAIYQSVAHVKEETEFRTHTRDTLDQIQATLRELQAPQSPKKVLQEIAALDNKQFVQNLPALRKVTQQPPAEVAPSAPVLREVAQKLHSIGETAPDYWPTVLEFIRFASAGLSPDVPPRGAGQMSIINNRGEFSLGSISHRVVLLDGGDLVNTHFDHSRIIFTEHPVHMENVVFRDCVFELPISNTPNPYLQNASRSLLASEISSITLSSM